MEYFILIIKASFEDFRKSKVRTFLTSLGILIGVASVVLLLALGLGLKKYIQQQFESMGTNMIYVMPANMMRSGGMGGIQFDDRDFTNLKKVKNVSVIAPFFVKVTKVQGDGKTETSEIAASTADVFPLMNLEIEKGKAYTKSDVDKGNKVVVLGPSTAKKLFGTIDNAINKVVKIEGQGYKVIGVPKSKGGGGFGGQGIDDHVYMPTTAALSFNPTKKYFGIYLKTDSSNNISQIKSDSKKILTRRYKSDDFDVIEQTEFLNTINSIFTILNMVLVAIAAISLVVGGIGIMNIMYVSVTERIKEIGIRRAIGATKRDILFQFLTESVILSTLGGLLGLGVSYAVVILVQSFFPAYINLTSILIAIGVSSIIGIVFGVFPAKKAADLSPIDAIRYE